MGRGVLSVMTNIQSLCLMFVILGCLLRPGQGITCYTCQPDQVTSNGTCEEEHKAQWCQHTDWCFKAWRGQEDTITGIRWGCMDVSPTPGTQDLCVSENKGDITEKICYCSSDLCNY